MAITRSDQQQNANIPFTVVKLPYIGATDEQCINNVHCHHSPLTFALSIQQQAPHFTQLYIYALMTEVSLQQPDQIILGNKKVPYVPKLPSRQFEKYTYSIKMYWHIPSQKSTAVDSCP